MRVPRTISHYDIVDKVGEGGMGIVYLATDRRLGRQVALKQLRPDLLFEPDLKERFLQEARTVSALNHPNIVTIYDVENVDGVDVIAMEYVRGRSLQSIMAANRLTVEETLRYAVQVARALEAAHTAGIVHRDIKPANIMVSESGLVKVLDFGLAKMRGSRADAADATASGSPRTADGVLMGTVAYMSPEQASVRELDGRSDIFSFGVMLHEMLAGKRPFQGASNAELLTAVLRDQPAPLRDSLPDVPAELERVVTRCLRKDPARRFQSAADLRVALQELSDEFESGTLASVSLPPVARASAVRTQRAWLWPAAGLAALGILGAGAWWMRSARESAQPVAIKRLTADPGLTSFPAISPDGSLAAFASDRSGDGNLDLYVQQVSGGNPIRLTQFPTDEYEAVFSPDGTRIAFRSEREGGGVYVIPTLGGEPRLIVQHGRSPAWSPDGTMLAYEIGSPGVGGTFSFGQSSIHTIAVAGGESRKLAPDFAVAHHPVWAADGKHVVFEGSKNPGPPSFDLWVAPVDGGAVIASGAFKALRERGLRTEALPFALEGETLVLSAGSGDTTNLWRAKLSRTTWEIVGEPKQITFGAGEEILPSLSKNGRILFSAGSRNMDLWELPADTNGGRVTGPARQLTRETGDEFYPVLSGDGKTAVYVARRSSAADDLWVLDTATGKQRALLSTPGTKIYPKLTADGSSVFFGQFQGVRPLLFRIGVSGGAAEKLCETCGVIRDVNADGSAVLLQAGQPPETAYVARLDPKTGKVEELIRNPREAIYAPKFSPDGQWIAFQTVSPQSRTLHAAAVKSPNDWIALTDGKTMDRNPAWSPDGKLLYFLSERDGFRCIWAQRLDGAARKPVGAAFAVEHFHQAVRSLMNIDAPGQVSVTVGPDRLVFSMGEIRGNVWMSELR